MPRCLACSGEVPEGSRFCPQCAAPLVPVEGAATKPWQPPEVKPLQTPFPASDQERFVPGQVLAGRYRVVAMLGKGGMGEVYRADDLTLGQSVALKFLPATLIHNPDRLARFRNEVRIARQVSHPNVCRVHDIGEHEGQPFLTMEFVDGQDLAGLLRQVGRLPEDRTIELARQMCLGLAAVHDKDVLHRDLKPHNVMIDGRGQVRLSDFGLAVASDGHEAHGEVAGTPAYMAPEQLAGKGVSVQSDLFSLGLILYELITGKRPFAGKTREELRQLHEGSAPSKPSSHVGGLNPALEAIILRCLEKDPADRPRSAYEVLAALPGGDPLAAALAQGQTPSPKMVADAPVEGTLPPWLGLTLLATVLLALVAAAFLFDETKLFRQAHLDISAQELTIRARDITRKLGYTERPLDTAVGFAEHPDSLKFLRDQNAFAQGWDVLHSGQPAVLYFWYRQSPQRLVSMEANWLLGFGTVPGQVSVFEPPNIEPGMVTVCLDPKGRLIEFHAVPPRVAETGAARQPDWRLLFEQAGLDLALFRETSPSLNPPVHSDPPKAWEGVYAGRPEIPIRVEAAAYRGRPVFFHVGPKERPPGLHAAPPPPPAGLDIFEPILAGIVVFVFTGGAWLARRNLRLGRANWTGAWRLAAFHLAVYTLYWMLVAKHVPSFGQELVLFSAMLGLALFTALELWLAYLALEPYVRRRWPWWVVSWNRLLEGRFRDPLVGRDILVGGSFGVLCVLLVCCQALTARWNGWGPPESALPFIDMFTGSALVPVSLGLITALLPAMTDFLLVFLLFLLLRRTWLAFGAYFLLMMAGGLVTAEHPFPDIIFYAAWHAGWLLLLWQFGFLAYASGAFFYFVLFWLPLTTDPSVWYAGQFLPSLLILVGLAVYGFVLSLGGRPLMGKGFFGEE